MQNNRPVLQPGAHAPLTNVVSGLPGTNVGAGTGMGSGLGAGLASMNSLKWSSVYNPGTSMQIGNNFPRARGMTKQFLQNQQHMSQSKKKVRCIFLKNFSCLYLRCILRRFHFDLFYAHCKMSDI